MDRGQEGLAAAKLQTAQLQLEEDSVSDIRQEVALHCMESAWSCRAKHRCEDAGGTVLALVKEGAADRIVEQHCCREVIGLELYRRLLVLFSGDASAGDSDAP